MRDNCLPGVKDVVLASLFQDTSNDFILEETINLRTNSENKMETLTPPEFVEEFEKDLSLILRRSCGMILKFHQI